MITEDTRCDAVRKIFAICAGKKYKRETIFTAIGIMDRYLAAIGHWNFPRDQMTLLIATCTLLAAKMEESLKPSIRLILEFLDDGDLF